MTEIFQFSKYLLNSLPHNAQEKVLSVARRLELRQDAAFLQNLGRSLGFEATIIGGRWFSPIVGFAPKFPFSSHFPLRNFCDTDIKIGIDLRVFEQLGDLKRKFWIWVWSKIFWGLLGVLQASLVAQMVKPAMQET